jgi:hypothetical protein
MSKPQLLLFFLFFTCGIISAQNSNSPTTKDTSLEKEFAAFKEKVYKFIPKFNMDSTYEYVLLYREYESPNGNSLSRGNDTLARSADFFRGTASATGTWYYGENYKITQEQLPLNSLWMWTNYYIRKNPDYCTDSLSDLINKNEIEIEKLGKEYHSLEIFQNSLREIDSTYWATIKKENENDSSRYSLEMQNDFIYATISKKLFPEIEEYKSGLQGSLVYHWADSTAKYSLVYYEESEESGVWGNGGQTFYSDSAMPYVMYHCRRGNNEQAFTLREWMTRPAEKYGRGETTIENHGGFFVLHFSEDIVNETSGYTILRTYYLRKLPNW